MIPQFGVLLTLAYDGTNYHGWALQKDVRSVEETLRGAILEVDPTASTLRATSRTDAGVHAEAQLVAFDTNRELSPRSWVLMLNKHLPDDVSVRAARSVHPGYSPRLSSRGKRYRYRLLLDRVRDPLLRHRAWRIGWRIDLDRMVREAARAEGTHDFAAFRTSSDERVVTTRTLWRVGIDPSEGSRVVGVVVEGNAFLHMMVRILVGTLVDVGRGQIPEGAITRALESGKRHDAGMTAPPEGLTLEWIDVALPDEVGTPWPDESGPKMV